MRLNTLRLAVAAGTLLWGASVAAQGTIIVTDATDRTTRVGTRGANFLHVGVGARSQGLGTAAGSMIDGPEAMFWNPAGIVTRDELAVFVSYMQLFGNSGVAEGLAPGKPVVDVSSIASL